MNPKELHIVNVTIQYSWSTMTSEVTIFIIHFLDQIDIQRDEMADLGSTLFNQSKFYTD